ncbi:MAG TPA: phosphate ABC transporter permease subunit PstC [Microbacteriaceae bacterium]
MTSNSSVRSDRSGAEASLRAQSFRLGEKIIIGFLFATAALSVAVTTGIVFSLFSPLPEFFSQVPVTEFFWGTIWAPSFNNPSYAVWPIVAGTVQVVMYSMLVAVPLGLASAIYLSEYASNRVRKTIKPILEILEGIPTVATGLFALFWLRPFIENLTPWLPWEGPFAIGVAGVAVGLIIIPLIASVSDDAMRSVPRALREGAYALGATKMRVALKVVLPAAISGVVAAFVLGASRAVGETMVVLLVAGGGNPKLVWGFTEASAAMTAFIASKATGEIATGTLDYYTIFAVGSLLFLMTLAMNAIAIRFVNKFREVYE